ncbi:hypothetical protein DL768_003704 [Monosporascus sp. mg162]|nr:hypothetical protein DL768_003704 [Monosporascus sp. mg162]
MAPKAIPKQARRSRMAQVVQAQNDQEERAQVDAANGADGSANANVNGAPAAKANVPAKGTRHPTRKRKNQEEEQADEEEEVVRPAKRTKSVAKPKREYRAKHPAKSDTVTINKAPKQILDIFVFGEGSSGELGLGSKKYDSKKPIDVKRPRINHNLDSKKVGVVQVACGGMHAVALTKDNKIYTWGVNDDRALGRDTTWDGGLRDINAEDTDDEDDDDSGLNPLESTPGEVSQNHFSPGDIFSQVAATDSASFALTTDGRVYGWGTFRGSDGVIGFDLQTRVQPAPVEIRALRSITKLACGSNHVVALDKYGKVYTFGSGGQYQLGRKATTRHEGTKAGLRPECCYKFSSKMHAVDISAGSYHSFFIDNHGEVWGWGLNNYSQTGHNDGTGQDDAMVLMPRPIDSLSGRKISQIVGGEHHTVACTEDGELLTWGRIDGHQVGQSVDKYNEDNTVFDENKRPRILVEPTLIPGIHATFVAAGTDTSFAIDEAGKVYSWGFSANYQTGQGTGDDVEVPKLIDNTAVRDRKIIWAGAGGQYSIVAAESENAGQNGQVNGHGNGGGS